MPSSTSSSERAPARPRAAATAAALIGLLLAVEVTVAVALRDRPSPVPYHGRPLRAAPAAGQVVVLGDSTVLMGIEAPRLAAGLGRPVDTSWHPAPHSWVGAFQALRRRLATGPPPALVVLMFSPYSLREPLDEERYLAHFATFPEILELRRAGVVGTRSALEMALTLGVPTLRHRASLRALLLPGVRGGRAARGRRGWWKVLRGGAPGSTQSYPGFAKNVRLVREYLAQHPFAPSAQGRFFLEKTLAAAGRAAVPVLIVPGPLYEGVFRTPAERAYFLEGSAFLADVAARHPGTRLLWPAPELFAQDEMWNNHVHLNAAGRTRLTGLLVRGICGTVPPVLGAGCGERDPDPEGGVRRRRGREAPRGRE